MISLKIKFSFQPNKLGQIYVEWYIKTQILRYVSACSVGRKTYYPKCTLCNGNLVCTWQVMRVENLLRCAGVTTPLNYKPWVTQLFISKIHNVNSPGTYFLHWESIATTNGGFDPPSTPPTVYCPRAGARWRRWAQGSGFTTQARGCRGQRGQEEA